MKSTWRKYKPTVGEQQRIVENDPLEKLLPSSEDVSGAQRDVERPLHHLG